MFLELDRGVDGPLLRMLARMTIKQIKVVGRACKHLRSSVRDLLRKKAASRIRQSWRWQFPAMSTEKLAVSFLAANLGETQVRTVNFQNIVRHLRDETVIRSASQFLRRLSYGSKDAKKHNPRVFLAGVMAAYFTQNVFERSGDTEKAVADAALPLLERVQSIATALAACKHFRGVSPEYLRELPGLFETYERNFWAWKQPDMAMLNDRINKALELLVKALVDVPFDPRNVPAQEEMRVHIRRLRNKLVNIGGPRAASAYDGLHASTIPWETLDEFDPVDWEIWANHCMVGAFDVDWEMWATRRMAGYTD